MEAEESRSAMTEAPGVGVGFGRVFSWGLFDFANTIFSANILSLYFALWVTVDHGAEDIVYSLAFSGSMLVVAVVSPMLGAISDRYGRRIPFLLFFTLVSVAFTAAIGRVGGLTVALFVFALANLAYQSGNVFYDALLPTVSHAGNRGRISGFGVALGYVGTIAGILMVTPFVDRGGREAAFLPTAVLFLLFAIPCFLFVKEERPTVPWRFRMVSEGYTQLARTLGSWRRHANLLRFIGARFLYGDSVNTLLTFMAVYVTKVIGFDDDQVRMLFIIATSFAVLGAFGYGRLLDRIGPKRTLSIVLIQWALVFLAVAVTFSQPAFWVIGALAGVALGGTWTSDRVLLTRLAPPEQLGEFFGLYRVAGRLAAVVGPLLWGGTLLVFSDLGTLRFRIAVLMLLVPIILGYLVLRGVKEGPAEPTEGRSPAGGPTGGEAS